MMKKDYQKPALEVIGFEIEDVITTSSNGDFIGTAPGFDWGEWPES